MLGMKYEIELQILLIILLAAWLSILIVRRRTRSGIATVQERRFESAIRTFAVELDAFKFAPQQAVKVLLRHDHVISEARLCKQPYRHVMDLTFHFEFPLQDRVRRARFGPNQT